MYCFIDIIDRYWPITDTLLFADMLSDMKTSFFKVIIMWKKMLGVISNDLTSCFIAP